MATRELPWHAAYPGPNADVVFISREEVLALINDPQAVAGKDYVLVDLRRNDYQGGTIQGSINLPAQSMYPILPTYYTLLKAAGVRKVIFYCGESFLDTVCLFTADAADNLQVRLVVVDAELAAGLATIWPARTTQRCKASFSRAVSRAGSRLAKSGQTRCMNMMRRYGSEEDIHRKHRKKK